MAYRKRREDEKAAVEKTRLEGIRRFFVKLQALPVTADSVSAERHIIERIIAFTEVPDWCKVAGITLEEVETLKQRLILTEAVRQKVLEYLRVRLERKGMSVSENEADSV